jgi:hypothetical protein
MAFAVNFFLINDFERLMATTGLDEGNGSGIL